MRNVTIAATLLSLAAAPLAAMDSHVVGPRALGMGGAGTAAVDDHTASYWNPGMYGFFSRTGEDGAKLAADPNHVGRKDWGVGIVDASVHVDVRGELANLIEVASAVDLSDVATLGTGGEDDLKAAMATLAMIEDFTPDRDTVSFAANIGVANIRIGHFGIGLRIFAEGIASLSDVDRINVGIGTDSITSIAQEINNPSVSPSGWTSGHNATLITGSAASNLDAAMLAAGVVDASARAEAISKLDYAASQAGLSADQVAQMTAVGGSLYDAILASTDPSKSFENNTTAAFSAGYSVTEVPISYGHAINDHLAVGGSLKLMVGKVAAAKVRLLDDNADVAELLQDSLDDAKQTVTAGVDLGVVLRNSWAQVGLTARNINSPVLEGGTYQDADGRDFDVEDVTLEPQVSLGVALYPFETLCLTADLDLIECSTVFETTTDGHMPAGVDRTLRVEYASQRLGGGVEWNAFRFLALRAGASTDLAETDAGTMLHAGVGVNLWAVRLDLAGAVSTDTVTVDGDDYPRAADVSLGLMVDF